LHYNAEIRADIERLFIQLRAAVIWVKNLAFVVKDKIARQVQPGLLKSA
jgi:hypothetical protein